MHLGRAVCLLAPPSQLLSYPRSRHGGHRVVQVFVFRLEKGISPSLLLLVTVLLPGLAYLPEDGR